MSEYMIRADESFLWELFFVIFQGGGWARLVNPTPFLFMEAQLRGS